MDIDTNSSNTRDSDEVKKGSRLIEIGPGTGALTRVLYEKYKLMTAIELDQRSITFLTKKLPGLNILHEDVLQINWQTLSSHKQGRLKIIANLPYYIVSQVSSPFFLLIPDCDSKIPLIVSYVQIQVLFSLADAHDAIESAVLTMQYEVRIVS